MQILEAQQLLIEAMQAGDREAVQRIEADMLDVPGWVEACEQSLAVWQALAWWQHRRLLEQTAQLQTLVAQARADGVARGIALVLRQLGEPGEN